MTTKAACSPEEWKVVLEGPPSAGMIVVTAAHGGMFKETVAMSKAYVEARSQHGASELLDEIVEAKPAMDHTRYHSVDELRDNGLEHLRSAVTLLEGKATPGEVDDYRRFVLALGRRRAEQRHIVWHCPAPLFGCVVALWGKLAGPGAVPPLSADYDEPARGSRTRLRRWAMPAAI